MAKSLLVKIEPLIIKYARKYSGYSIENVSKKTKISTEKLKSYEEEKLDIPLTHLEKFAIVYKRPLAFFLLSKIPDGAVEPKDFRIVYASDGLPFSPEAFLAIRRARYVQSTIKELVSDKFDYKLKKFSLQDDPNLAADWLRDYLNIKVIDQIKWSNPSQALKTWKSAFESKGMFVLQSSLPKDEISAFCFADKAPYIIFLNSSEHEFRRIFSLFHEAGHLLLNNSGVCLPDNLSKNSYEYVKIEKYCNQFAAAFLLPNTEFMANRDVESLISQPSINWSDESLKRLSNLYKVSKEVVLRKFLTLGKIDENFYEKRRNQWIKEALENKPKKKRPIIIPQYRKCISQNGLGFVSLILDQYHMNKMSFSAAAEMLNINPKHVSKLEFNLS